MRKILLAASAVVVISGVMQACKKDSYNYSCRCTDPTDNLADTFINYNVPTSGQAYYYCNDFADTANKYGRPYECSLSK